MVAPLVIGAVLGGAALVGLLAGDSAQDPEAAKREFWEDYHNTLNTMHAPPAPPSVKTHDDWLNAMRVDPSLVREETFINPEAFKAITDELQRDLDQFKGDGDGALQRILQERLAPQDGDFGSWPTAHEMQPMVAQCQSTTASVLSEALIQYEAIVQALRACADNSRAHDEKSAADIAQHT
ncbi:hypothetical protein [Streptosporangium sp. KLBMP 9127]|nr:hypothetical protein [Streptosporangium sp. KLBMP 9127]